MKSGLIDSSGREETILGLRYLVHPHPWLQVETVTPERILRQRFLGQFQDHYQPNHHTHTFGILIADIISSRTVASIKEMLKNIRERTRKTLVAKQDTCDRLIDSEWIFFCFRATSNAESIYLARIM